MKTQCSEAFEAWCDLLVRKLIPVFIATYTSEKS